MTVFTAEKIQYGVGPEMWGGGTLPRNTMNVAGLYLQLLALFILTSISCDILSPNDFRDKH